jgi:prefoldin subunit 5
MELPKEKLKRLNEEIKNLRQKLYVLNKEKFKIEDRIKTIENSINRIKIDNDCILNYKKIKKLVVD